MDNSESYQVVIDNLKKILTKKKTKKFSLVDILPTDVFAFQKLKSGLTKHLENSLLIVDNTRFKEEEYRIKYKDFIENEIEILEKTKNAFVIHNRFEGKLDDFDRMQNLYQSYYPAIFLFYKDINDINPESNNNWKILNFSDEKILIMINRNFMNFDKFTFEAFEFSKPKKLSSISSVKEYKQASGKRVELKKNPLPKKSIAPVYQQAPKDEPNYSIFDGLPSPSIYPADYTSKKWMKEFYNYLRDLIMIIIPENKKKCIDIILNKDTLKSVWIPVFTTATENPNRGENYEELESVGDKLAKFVFAMYYKKRYPESTEADLNNANQLYESDQKQIILGERMGFLKWIKVDSVLQTNKKFNEDILEAFIGGIDRSLEDAGYYGASISIIYNFYKLLYDDMEIYAEQDPKTKLNQIVKMVSGTTKLRAEESQIRKFFLERPHDVHPEIFEKMLTFGNEIIAKEEIEGVFAEKTTKKKGGTEDTSYEKTYRDYDGKTTIDVYITDFAVEVFKKYGIIFKRNELLGKAKGMSKEAGREAYKKALETLRKRGITNEWIEEKKILKNFSRINPHDHERALLKAKSINSKIRNIDIKTKTLAKDMILMLIGIDEQGRKYIIHRYITENKNDNNYGNLISDFVK